MIELPKQVSILMDFCQRHILARAMFVFIIAQKTTGQVFILPGFHVGLRAKSRYDTGFCRIKSSPPSSYRMHHSPFDVFQVN